MPVGVYVRRNIVPTMDKRTVGGRRWKFKHRLLLTQEKKDAIVADRKAGMSLKHTAVKHGVSVGTVCKLVNGTGWNPTRPAQYLMESGK